MIRLAARLARAPAAAALAAHAALCGLVWCASTAMLTYPVPGRLAGLAAPLGGAVLAASLLALAYRLTRALPEPEARDALARLTRLVPLVVVDVVLLSALAPVAAALARLPGWRPEAQAAVAAGGWLAAALAPLLLGATLAALAVLGAVGAGTAAARRAPALGRSARRAARVATAAAALYCGAGAAVALNGALDAGPAAAHRTELRAVRGVAPGAGLAWAELRSWRGGALERVPLATACAGEGGWCAAAGRPVIVRLRPGRFGIPWVERVTADREPEWEALLAALPSAGAPRRALVESLLRQGRWAEAVAHARAYAAHYPADRAFLGAVADALRAGRQLDAARALERGGPEARAGGAG